jgi:hypothetical protein
MMIPFLNQHGLPLEKILAALRVLGKGDFAVEAGLNWFRIA